MNRREWLKRAFGAAVAVALVPLVNLEDATPGFWNQPALRDFLKFRISFPDGTTFSFDGLVIGEGLTADGVDLTVRPLGFMKIETGQSTAAATATLALSGKAIGEVVDVGVSAEPWDLVGSDGGIIGTGLVRRSDVIFTIKPAE